MTFNPSILRDAEHRDKFKAFLRGYTENGGSALQINLIDADMLRDAQRRRAVRETLTAHRSRLEKAGFRHVGVWLRYFNFVSLIAIR